MYKIAQRKSNNKNTKIIIKKKEAPYNKYRGTHKA